MGINLYDSQSNYNAIVAAASGKGKSFFANQLIRSTWRSADGCGHRRRRKLQEAVPGTERRIYGVQP